ncbi:MAG: D-Ala-D-Ala carboxypeptidase family metallohydrolase, partial [Pseudomonadota bacterium]
FILLVFLSITFSLYAMELRCDDKGNDCRLIVPNSEIIPVWEHSCMKHIAAGEIDKARGNKCVIEWQKVNKKEISLDPSEELTIKGALATAKAAMEQAGNLWGCNPPIDPNNPDSCRPSRQNQNLGEAKLSMLEIGLDPQALVPITDTFVSSSDKAITIRAKTVPIINCGSKTPLWTISFPDMNIKKDIQEKDLSVEFPIPLKPQGDRGNSLSIKLQAGLNCNDNDEYITKMSIKQDDQDLLRQEYLDMKKSRLPQRNELSSNCMSKHFSFGQFNSSRNIAGSKYSSILCLIFDRLEQTREAAGNAAMSINSGYRNPYKNGITKGSGRESMHIYGIAADIRLADFNGDGVVNFKDRELMVDAAKAKGACIEPDDRTPTWIHMDWRGVCPAGW